VVAGRARLGRWLEAEGRAEGEVPWEEAAVAVLHGGRTTAVEGRVYSRGLSRHLLLQAGARERRLSLLPSDPGTARRPTASQSLWVAGADVVLWGPGAAVRGEMLDDALIAPVTLASAMTLAYRHYDVTTRTAPEFGALIGLAPRGAVDEASASTTFASPGGRVGLELRGGLAHDAARRVRAWRAGGTLLVVPIPAVRFALGYEEATEYATGLSGRRRTGRLSFHADL
jgi:hypothetical protein